MVHYSHFIFIPRTQGIDLIQNAPAVSGMLTENQTDSDDDDNYIIEENIIGVQNAKATGDFGFGNDMMDEVSQHGNVKSN